MRRHWIYLIRAYSCLKISQFTHIFQWVTCVIIYGFTISNPCQETQHVEIVPIICGLVSHCCFPSPCKGTTKEVILRQMRFNQLLTPCWLTCCRKRESFPEKWQNDDLCRSVTWSMEDWSLKFRQHSRNIYCNRLTLINYMEMLRFILVNNHI